MNAKTKITDEDEMTAELQEAVKRITDLERTVAELSATTAPVSQMGKIQIDLGKLSSQTDVSSEEIKNLRTKQESDMEKSLQAAKQAADSNKPDYKVILSAFGLMLALMGALTGYVTSGDSRIENTLTAEINEAKAAASSAGKKAVPVMDSLNAFIADTTDKIEDIQQRVPSASEWMKADSTIEHLRQEKIRLLERVKGTEGLITRSLERIDSNKEASQEELADLDARIQTNLKSVTNMLSRISQINASLKGTINELEAQCRGTSAYFNAVVAQLRQSIGEIYQTVHERNLPDIEYFSDRVCAQAFVNIGEVNGG